MRPSGKVVATDVIAIFLPVAFQVVLPDDEISINVRSAPRTSRRPNVSNVELPLGGQVIAIDIVTRETIPVVNPDDDIAAYGYIPLFSLIDTDGKLTLLRQIKAINIFVTIALIMPDDYIPTDSWGIMMAGADANRECLCRGHLGWGDGRRSFLGTLTPIEQKNSVEQHH